MKKKIPITVEIEIAKEGSKFCSKNCKYLSPLREGGCMLFVKSIKTIWVKNKCFCERCSECLKATKS